MTFAHAATKSCTNFSSASSWRRPPRARAARSSTPNTRSAREPVQALPPVAGLEAVVGAGGAPDRAEVEQVDEEVVRQRARAVGEDTVGRAAVLAPSTRRPPTRTVISGALRLSRLALSTRRYSAGSLASVPQVVAEAVGLRLEPGERLDVGLLLGGVAATRGERHLDVDAGRGRRLLDRRVARQHDSVGERLMSLASKSADALERRDHAGELLRVVDLPAALRLEADAATVGAAALVGVAERRCGRPRGRDQLATVRPASATCCLTAATSLGGRGVRRRPGSGPARGAPPRGPRGRGSGRPGPCRGGSA